MCDQEEDGRSGPAAIPQGGTVESARHFRILLMSSCELLRHREHIIVPQESRYLGTTKPHAVILELRLARI